MLSLAGKVTHRNGNAPLSGANADRVDFGSQVKYVVIRNTHATRALDVSFDNWQTVWQIAAATELSGHWFLDHLHLRGAHAVDVVGYEIIATQMT